MTRHRTKCGIVVEIGPIVRRTITRCPACGGKTFDLVRRRYVCRRCGRDPVTWRKKR